MRGIFNFDSPIFQVITKIGDCMILSILWVVFSLPVVTIGASTTALYYTATKVIRHDRGYVYQEFWRCFKSSFKQSTMSWLLYAVFSLFLFVDGIMISGSLPVGTTRTVSLAVFIGLFVFMTMILLYMLAYTARFEQSWRDMFRNSIFLTFRHLPSSVLAAAVTAACISLEFWVMPLVLILPCGWGIAVSYVFERVFKKYMSAEDLAKEEILNSTRAGE